MFGSIKTHVLSNLEDRDAEPSSSEVLNVDAACLCDPHFGIGYTYILYIVKESIVKDVLYSKRKCRTDSIVTVSEAIFGTQQQQQPAAVQQ